jgi:poly(3-hydroxyalkanoate) synthetase
LNETWPNQQPLRQKLLPLLAPHRAALQQPDAAAALQRTITARAIERARQHIAAIRLYQLHPACRILPDPPVLWQEGTTRLLDYGAGQGAPLLVIPSLINRAHILDLDHNHSFLRFLARSGLRPLLVDWGEPGESERDFTISDYVNRLQRVCDAGYGLRAAGKTKKHNNNTALPVLGYCMGGNLALALAVLRPELVRSLTLMATPWDFSPQHYGHAITEETLQRLLPLIGHLGYLPIDALQSLFAAFQPEQLLTKFRRFAALEWDSAAARRFVLVEDWLNDGIPLVKAVAEECLAGWYGLNLPGQLQWRVGGQIIDPRRITMPTQIIFSTKDKIVPPGSALPLARLLPQAELCQSELGHVGLMASERAPSEVWAKQLKFLASA